MAKSKNVALNETAETYKAPATYGEYKGRPTISLPLVEGSSFKFTFGITKARLILEYLSEIKEFASKYESKK